LPGAIHAHLIGTPVRVSKQLAAFYIEDQIGRKVSSATEIETHVQRMRNSARGSSFELGRPFVSLFHFDSLSKNNRPASHFSDETPEHEINALLCRSSFVPLWFRFPRYDD
jgi:hypothetical protein